MLPFELSQAIEEMAFSISPGDLARAGEELSALYRENQGPGRTPRLSPEHLAAYLVVRFPATFAACEAVFSELQELLPAQQPLSILDLGGGPGTALWAAQEVFLSLEKATVYEQLKSFLSLGEKLAGCTETSLLKTARWVRQDLLAMEPPAQHDLVVFSYSLGEIPVGERERLLRQAWDATAQTLVIIEPGTVPGFQGLLAARDLLLQWGGVVVAPCPHGQTCPMAGTESWCHFSKRLERSRRHRLAKGGALGYEDEKYSYLIVSREAIVQSAARILSPVRVNKVNVVLDLCTTAGRREERLVLRKEKQVFKAARRLVWGDRWDGE
jgi:ribosomal protein RSM22 (predicted rRNA methylase)